MFTKQRGQSLIEVLVALTITVIMIVALIAFVLSGLRNAQFAQKQSKATKIATETMEQIKTIRDRDGEIFFSYGDGSSKTATKFSQLWSISMSSQLTCHKNDNSAGPCYFNLSANPTKLIEVFSPPPANEAQANRPAQVQAQAQAMDVRLVLTEVDIGDGFKRQIIFEDSSPLDSSKEKRVTVNVFWTDSTGDHNSNIQTILSPAI